MGYITSGEKGLSTRNRERVLHERLENEILTYLKKNIAITKPFEDKKRLIVI